MDITGFERIICPECNSLPPQIDYKGDNLAGDMVFHCFDCEENFIVVNDVSGDDHEESRKYK